MSANIDIPKIGFYTTGAVAIILSLAQIFYICANADELEKEYKEKYCAPAEQPLKAPKL